MLLIAIDPGKSGGIAIKPDNQPEVAWSMPDTDSGVIELIDHIIPEYSTIQESKVCYMEKVSGFIGGRMQYMNCPTCRNSIAYRTGDPGKTMFTFGYGNGFLVSTFMTRKIKLEMVTPQKWMKGIGVGSKNGMGKTEWKRFLKDRASKWFPNIKVTLKTADALLILKYATIIHLNNQLPF